MSWKQQRLEKYPTAPAERVGRYTHNVTTTCHKKTENIQQRLDGNIKTDVENLCFGGAEFIDLFLRMRSLVSPCQNSGPNKTSESDKPENS